MSQNILIGTFGGGAGIITSLLDCFMEFLNLHFDKLILVTTNHPKIIQGYKEFETHQIGCPVCNKRYANLDTCLDVISAKDIVTEEDNHNLLLIL